MRDTYDLVIIGAGICGLNALFVATQYLPKDAQVLLVDRRDACGGMWTDAYPYVRLHQPHSVFTVGDIPWDWSKPSQYLARRDEVQGHLAHCLKLLRDRVHLTELFGHDAQDVTEITTATGPRAQVSLRSVSGGPTQTVTADRAIHAAGANVQMQAPLTLTSSNVVSTAPNDLPEVLAAHPDAPAFVVGGGKTGMDTVLAVMADNPQRNITLINGRGTFFLDRDENLPGGWRRWYGSTLANQIFGDIAMRFDGHNEIEVMDHIRQTYSTTKGGTEEQYFYGVQSQAERATIDHGLDRTLRDYLTDVVDTGSGPQIVLRSGDTVDVPKGALIINCTGHFPRKADAISYPPGLSAQGTILSFSTGYGMHFLSSLSGYFMTHLFYRGQLPDTPVYLLEFDHLAAKDRNAWVPATATQSFYNVLVLMDALPFKVLDQCGLDFDRLFPLPRRIASLIDFKWNKRRYIDHCRTSMDEIAKRYDVKFQTLS